MHRRQQRELLNAGAEAAEKVVSICVFMNELHSLLSQLQAVYRQEMRQAD